MFSTLRNAWKIPDLRKKILFTLAMIVIFRLGSNIVVPGVNLDALDQQLAAYEQAAANGTEGITAMVSLMTGGAFTKLAVFALGIGPYITASIIINLLTMAIPYFENLAKEGEAGRRKMATYTRFGTVILALIQSVALVNTMFRGYFVDPLTGISSLNIWSGSLAVLVLTAGTALLMYLGEKINEHGIGNGISIFIFSGIIARIPNDVSTMIAGVLDKSDSTVNIGSFIGFIVIAFFIIIGVIYINQGQRRIPVQYAKRVVGRKMYGGQSSHIPLKVNQTGVIPVIFAMSIIMIPQTIGQFLAADNGFRIFVEKYFAYTHPVYMILSAITIIAFTFFYTAVTFNPVEVANNMKKNGGYIPGIRPGKPTSDYLMKTLNRLTWVGAFFLAFIATVPNVLIAVLHLQFRFGGTALLIAVGVSIEIAKQLEAQLVMRHYNGFLSK
ncbi:MAG: preprotein translocase subunit SecY [Clostridia bacterium]|nr:preprotein translocase subunit SecY [Clostridia bacterium]